jgi:hypothetical protein
VNFELQGPCQAMLLTAPPMFVESMRSIHASTHFVIDMWSIIIRIGSGMAGKKLRMRNGRHIAEKQMTRETNDEMNKLWYLQWLLKSMEYIYCQDLLEMPRL